MREVLSDVEYIEEDSGADWRKRKHIAIHDSDSDSECEDQPEKRYRHRSHRNLSRSMMHRKLRRRLRKKLRETLDDPALWEDIDRDPIKEPAPKAEDDEDIDLLEYDWIESCDELDPVGSESECEVVAIRYPRVGPGRPRKDAVANGQIRCHRGRLRSLCNIPGCTKLQQGGRVLEEDSHGPAGPRCQRHGSYHRLCVVDGCVKQAQGRKVLISDEFGLAGPRCHQHGAIGTTCNIPGCTTKAVGRRLLREDNLGPAGPRCRRHNGPPTLCNVVGCPRQVCGKIAVVDDRHGPRGPRCHKHNAHLPLVCNVKDCRKRAVGGRGAMKDDNNDGKLGPRCIQHGRQPSVNGGKRPKSEEEGLKSEEEEVTAITNCIEDE